MLSNVLHDKTFLADTVNRLYILDYGLFQVHENNRIIGIMGFLIQTRDGQNILVDTGFPPKYAADPDRASLEDGLESFGRVLHLSANNLPAGQLARIGLSPEEIDMLIMTHTDVDHVGGLGDFLTAPVVIGTAERAMARPRYFEDHTPLEWPENVTYRQINQDTVLAPGLAILTTPGHSPGHLSLAVRLAETGMILLTGDAISRPAELEDDRYGGAWDQEAASASARKLMAIAAEEEALIIFGHDPAQWETLKKAPAYYS